MPELPNKFTQPGGLKLGAGEAEAPPMPPVLVGNPVPGAWGGRIGRIDPDDPEVLGRPPTGGRRLAYGAAAFGGLLAAGWAMSKTLRRKSGPG